MTGHQPTTTERMGEGMFDHMSIYVKLGATLLVFAMLSLAASGSLIDSAVYHKRHVKLMNFLMGMAIAMIAAVPLLFLHWMWFSN